jgi:hypothetical protein
MTENNSGNPPLHAHDNIYLIDMGDEIVWCDDPDPDGKTDSKDVIKYVRADLAESPRDDIAIWISVDDRLPVNENPVLVYIPGTFSITASFYNHKFWRICGANYNHEGITHWMPLPSPPTIFL